MVAIRTLAGSGILEATDNGGHQAEVPLVFNFPESFCYMAQCRNSVFSMNNHRPFYSSANAFTPEVTITTYCLPLFPM